MPAALTAVAGLLVAAERRGGVELVERVGPHDARPQLVRHPEDPAALLGPDARRQPVRRVVGLRDRLAGGAEGEHGDDRPEDLLLGDAVALADAREDGGPEPEPVAGQVAAAVPALGALGLADLDHLLDPLELGPAVDRPDVGVLVHGVADPQRGEPTLEALCIRILEAESMHLRSKGKEITHSGLALRTLLKEGGRL